MANAVICYQGHLFQYDRVNRYDRCPCGETYEAVTHINGPLSNASLTPELDETKIQHMRHGTISLRTFDISKIKDSLVWRRADGYWDEVDVKVDPYSGKTKEELAFLRVMLQSDEWGRQTANIAGDIRDLENKLACARAFLRAKEREEEALKRK